ncbi:hypothetical protein SAMN05661091_5834 [Paenibacillus uliginis N3/975]|uniref:Uncharacterized protein n=1 Tax=Paenibacillus uliginis N3/975 TaxID=1313296 RepID=A0A1X7HV36_9BACL|nr:DUF6773 family protein [Paenibacillus uliginis]SMF92459.1 hypothetical protein SAMN05661091_5834 [Paenibacillus uliginis N3/975]
MKWFNRNRVEDERIVNMKNKIYKEVYILIMSICTISVVVKSFMLSDWKSSLLELVIVIAGGLYFGIRSVLLGIYSDEIEVHDSRSKVSFNIQNTLWGIGIGGFLALFFGIRSAVLYGDGTWTTGLWYFFLVTLVSLVINIPLFAGGMLIVHQLANRTSQKISQKDQFDS